ncbi:hypothetical protein [Geodermatophilus maliterrae]|uniref:Uncharacterized protein n=1 Tax=Geodermatophilus maliterrae TaxID=3162531 RepID=A0ABV3XJI9_9ACTN
MTASGYVTGAHVASVERHRLVLDRDGEGVVSVAHAVSRPVVDGLAASVCGTLVTAIADMDWRGARAVSRCQECQRIAD